jgi:polyisoprenoid-binding protein YceI
MHSRKIIATLILLLYVIPLHSQELTLNLLEDHKENIARFESDAPIEKVVGTTNRVFGFVTIDPHNISNGISGKISVDLVSLDTGISMRDRDMRSESFLNTDEYPTAMFLLKEVLQNRKRTDYWRRTCQN